MDRFLLHVLPHRFVKIRHYGLFATASAGRLERARELLGGMAPDADEVPSQEQELPEAPPERCPSCLFGTLTREEIPPDPTTLPVPDW